MSFKYELDFDNDILLGKGKNARKNCFEILGGERPEARTGTLNLRAKGVENELCHNFTMKEDETGMTKVLPGKVSDNYLFGPACDRQSRSVIYPCNRNMCRVPCMCKLCTKRITTSCSEQFQDHSRYHRVWHENCEFCDNLLQAFPHFNFWFLNSGKKLVDLQGLHRAEHFPVKPLVEHANQQEHKFNPMGYTKYSSPATYEEEYIKSLKLSRFLFSCHECDHHFKTKEEFREHVQKNHLVTKRFYHNYHNSNEDDDNFTCDHCGKKLRDKPEFVKHVMKEHYQYQKMYPCVQCGNEYSRLSELRRHRRCVHKPVLSVIQCSYCGKDFQRKDFLSAHVSRVHEQGDIFNCVKCNKRFNKKSTLDRHQSSSTEKNGSPKYQCNDCDKSFCTGKQLQAHVNDHKGLTCEHCGETFKFIHHLQRHVKNRKDLKCSYCDQDYCNKPSLRKHELKMHMDELIEK